MDLSQLDEKSIKILAKLMLALMELNVSLYEFFDGAIYEQLVKTKTKQNTVEILNSKDFFELLQKRGVRKKNNEHENLSKFLSLDPNYPSLLMLKKIAKALDEMAKNEELMQGILAAAGDDGEDDNGEGMQNDDDYEQEGFDNDQAQQNNDIMEDVEAEAVGEDERQAAAKQDDEDDYEEDQYDDGDEEF